MLYEKHIGEWETWHYLYLTRSEADRVFLSGNEASTCWRRNGGEWVRVNGESYTILKPEIDRWLREAAGHRYGEVWECDRYYYNDEERPKLPEKGGRFAWLEKFLCYADRDRSYHSGAWNAYKSQEKKEYRAYISFQEKWIRGPHTAEHLPVIFAMLYL